MSLSMAAAIFLAGLAAGTVNTIVGSGSLITFPTLLGFGYPAVVANVTNTVGLVPGALSGTAGYRRELRGQAHRLLVLGVASLMGGITGAVLLLVLPGSVFRQVIPALILVACGLIALQTWLSRQVESRVRGARHGGPGLFLGVYVTSVYGGYFGAAQSLILIALLGIFLGGDLQELNAAKNMLALLVNGVAAILFIAFSHVAWGAAGALAGGAVVGGQLGATIGRRLPPTVLKATIVAVGVAVAVRLLV